MDAPASSRVEVRRAPERGVYGRSEIARILDEGFVCHLGFVSDRAPVVLPTMYARSGDRLYVHGAPASRMLRSLRGVGSAGPQGKRVGIGGGTSHLECRRGGARSASPPADRATHLRNR